MEAYIVEESGGNFRKADLPRPTLRLNQVLIRISASGVNPLDAKIRAGKAAHVKQSLPAVLGVDMAGIVEEVGPDVTASRYIHNRSPIPCSNLMGSDKDEDGSVVSLPKHPEVQK